MSAWILCLLHSLCWAHPGPPVYLEVDIEEGRVLLRLHGEQQVVNAWLGLAPPKVDAKPSSEERKLPTREAEIARGTLEKLLAEHRLVTIDGVGAQPSIGRVFVPPDSLVGYGLPAISFSIEWKCTGKPERVGLVWKWFDGAIYNERVVVPVVFRSFGTTDLHYLTPDEPEYVWHRALVEPPERPHVTLVGDGVPLRARLPGPPILAGVVIAIALWLRFRRRISTVGCVATGAAAAVLSIALWSSFSIPLPWRQRVVIPHEAEALRLFEKLHRNVYAAFDAGSEGQIYDFLAASVDGELLDELYGEIFESLVMRGEGGAVSRVEKITVLAREARVESLVASEAPEFYVTWKWRAEGVVAHWGHEHRRINEYEADYTVRHDGRSWKIADVDVLDHSRVDK